MVAAAFPFLLFLLFPISFSQPLTGTFIDCGAVSPSTVNGLEWVPDAGYVSVGSPGVVITGYDVSPTLTTVRSFPLTGNVFKKFCYEIPVLWKRKYLVRTSYYYGGINGNVNPPVFDQIVDGIVWSVVNTTEDYGQRNPSYYEGIFVPSGKNLSVCLAANTYTDSDPFISAIEVVLLWDQLYNSTDFGSYSLSLIARHAFGYDGPMIRYLDDPFNRYWEPFGSDAFPQSTSRNLAASGIWTLPPPRVFQTRLARNLPEPLTLLWPTLSLPRTEFGYNYYIALYFADDQTSGSGAPRTLDVTINGVPYINNLTVNPAGVAVFANQWPLSGITNLTLTPGPGSTVGPLVNAGEVFRVLDGGNKTLARDVVAITRLKSRFRNPPVDWNGDPCLPRGYSWTGITCSEDLRIRIIALNLTGMGLSGSITPDIARMTGLTSILLGNNGLTGTIPNLSSLRLLETLHLEDNDLRGGIPLSLGNLTNLRELFLQNNNLSGQVPSNLIGKPGLTLRYTPGNPLLTTP